MTNRGLALICVVCAAICVLLGPGARLAGRLSAPANASQNQLSSPTTGTVSGLQLTNNFNNALDSVNTCNSGASAPVNQLSGAPSLGNCWLNTTANPYPVNFYDGADWLAPFYIDATNHMILNQVGGGTATIASAATTSLCADPQYFLTISGSVTITSFGAGCFIGQAKKITFSGALLLAYNAASLIIPGAANVTTAAGDVADVVYLGSGDWEVTNYQPATGQALINPAIDVGDVAWTFLQSPPSSKYLFAYGQAVSRSTYSVLNGDINPTINNITATNGSPTLTGFSDTTQIAAGTVVEASFFSAPTTITSCTTTTCTTAANANASTTGSIQLFPYGDGCGAGTACGSVGSNFNLPDCRGVTFAGRDNMGGTARGTLTSSYYGTSPDALGATGGAQSRTFTLAQGNLPSFTSTNSGIAVSNGAVSITTNIGTSGFGGTAVGIAAVTTANVAWSSLGINYSGSSNVAVSAQGTSSFSGSDNPVGYTSIQPTITANCMMRVLSMLVLPDVSSLPSLAANDNELAITERRRVA